MLSRTVFTAAALSVVASPAWADLAPEPTDPQSPYFWVAVLAAAAAIAGFFVWRRRRK